jgi:hypothetical protein
MPRKLTEEDVADLRRRHSEGLSVVDLAAEFGVSVRRAQRLVNGTAQPSLSADELDDGPVLEAVECFLASVTLDPAAGVLAEAARSLAGKLDAVKGSSAAASAAAAPALVRELTVTLDRLREASRREEPSPLDLIRARRDARLAAMREQYGDQAD